MKPPQEPASDASSPSDTSMVSDGFVANGSKLKEIRHAGTMVISFTSRKQLLHPCDSRCFPSYGDFSADDALDHMQETPDDSVKFTSSSIWNF